MSKRAKYTKYAPEVKAAISMTRMADLFPDLNIPRMTANYWIRQNYALSDPILEPLAEAVKKTRADLERLQILLWERDALVELLQEISGLTFDSSKVNCVKFFDECSFGVENFYLKGSYVFR
jgi:hypothetical protein